MRQLWIIALAIVFATSLVRAQQVAPSISTAPAETQPVRVKVYAVGPNVTAPELQPLNPLPLFAGKCKKDMDGWVFFSLIVDAAGKPRNITFRQALGSDFDKLALQIVSMDRFKPGTYEGAPVAIAQSVEVEIRACKDETKDDHGKKFDQLQLRFQPVQTINSLPRPPEEVVLTPENSSSQEININASQVYRVGGEVSAPVIVFFREAKYSNKARRAKFEGICQLSLIVDTQGMPQDVHIVKAAGMGLDENAIEAVRQYRFKPAMKNGVPVAAMMNVGVNFRLY